MADKIIIKRHPKEHFFDSASFQISRTKMGRVDTVERWKESELSGDEWRFSYHLSLFDHGKEIARHVYGVEPEIALRFAPLRIFDAWPGLNLSYGQLVTIKYYTREHLIFASEFASSRRLFAALSSDSINLRENIDIDFIALDNRRKLFCCQPACKEKPTVLYRIKKEFEPDGGETIKTPFRQQQYRHFCDKHKNRGDCGMDDNDANYEIVETCDANTTTA